VEHDVVMQCVHGAHSSMWQWPTMYVQHDNEARCWNHCCHG